MWRVAADGLATCTDRKMKSMRLPIVLGLVAVALPLASCGSSSSSTAPTGSTPSGGAQASNANKALQFATCLRSHGVPNFPDPTGGRLQLRVTNRNGATTVNGVQVNAPAFQSAMQACRPYLPNGGQPPQLSASRKQAMLQYAQCMRSHGVPNFPDPTFSGGGVQFRVGPAGGAGRSSPAFAAAQATCQSLLSKAIGPGAVGASP